MATSTQSRLGDVYGDGFRPIEAFTLENQNAVRNLAIALIENHGFSDGGALALAQAVADPSAVREQLGAPDEIKVFGGRLLTVTARISVFSAVLHVTNGRVMGATSYPASESDGDGTQPTYRPERDLTSPSGRELVLSGGTRARVVAALEAADSELLAQNDWEESIRMNGVFAPITTTVLQIETADGGPVWVLSAVDGSSRVASCHRILGLHPSDPVYGAMSEPCVSCGQLQQIMSVLHRSREDVVLGDIEMARAATLPATIVIGFRPDHVGCGGLVDALDEYVALLHLEPPAPWSGPARDNKIAASVIDALRGADVLDEARALWFAGMASATAGAASGLSEHCDERPADVVKTLTVASDTAAGHAVGLGLENVYELDEFWATSCSGRDVDDILDGALDELDGGAPGASATELASLASYHLTVHGGLCTQEPGSAEIRDIKTGLTRPVDKREPRAVVGAMLTCEHGLRALHRAIVDGRAGQPPQQINDDGTLAVKPNGELAGAMTNFWLRTVFRERPANPTENEPPTSPRQLCLAAIRRFRRHRG
jgi:hypothetical protein